ncbi:hypothetical protein [Paracraurococcus ruber]|uniref:Uncharacterized protein n=1 Tax=Paracraurococcus ruber TaxID=77675 RepID=A0ABS1CRD4_9PROT|nr:hypothetical protein [Paracraurococcus ruber]MBK1656857.1 hypothetical protein [Paracraurococcus ruber]TDG33972.1 hypothetical protein E2C05_01650 [Paracraurococcus ruber]
MSRRCTCARLLAALGADPRLRTLPLAARALWLLIAEAALATGGVLPFSGSARVSLLVAAPETEIETQLETLIAEGLLVREGDGLAVPLLADVAPAVASSRANGARGGRPRRGETPEQARLRRSQGSMVLPLPGGAGNPAKPGAETPDHDDDGQSSSSSSPSPTARVEPALALAREVAEMAGMDPARSAWSAREVQGWLQAGATPGLVRATVADVMTRARGVPSTLRYFTQEVERAVREGQRFAPAAAADTPQARWAAAFAEHCDRGGDPLRFPKPEAFAA